MRSSWLRWFSFFRAYEPVMFVTKSLKDPQLAWSWLENDAGGKLSTWARLAATPSCWAGCGRLRDCGDCLFSSRFAGTDLAPYRYVWKAIVPAIHQRIWLKLATAVARPAARPGIGRGRPSMADEAERIQHCGWRKVCRL